MANAALGLILVAQTFSVEAEVQLVGCSFVKLPLMIGLSRCIAWQAFDNRTGEEITRSGSAG